MMWSSTTSHPDSAYIHLIFCQPPVPFWDRRFFVLAQPFGQSIGLKAYRAHDAAQAIRETMGKRVNNRAPKLRHPLDIALGARIRRARMSQDPRVTQHWLAQEVGCTLQQIQKYETGENAVRFSRVCEIARALGIPVLVLIQMSLEDVPWSA